MFSIYKQFTRPFFVNYTPPTVDGTFGSRGRRGRDSMVG